jgi:hypothetical protein
MHLKLNGPASGALDDPLSPEAAATNRESISAAVLLVFLKERAPAADVTRGKQEAPNLLPETSVFVGVPNPVEVAGADIAKGIGGNGPLQPIKIGFVRVEQPHAGTDFAVNTHTRM